MNPTEIHAQQETDEEVLHYVREMQDSAPIRVDSIHSYLTKVRRRNITLGHVSDRMGYLVDRGLLCATTEWVPGEGDVKFYTITADGRDVLDKVIPFPGRK